MRRVVCALLFLWLVATGAASAQTPVPIPSPVPATYKLSWDHDGVNVASWKLTIDGTDQAITPTGPTNGDDWEVAFPALTPGNHTLTVSACNISGCGTSDPLSVRVVVVPARPTGLRITGGL